MSELQATCVKGPDLMRGMIGTLGFDAISVWFSPLNRPQAREDWDWTSATVTMSSEVDRRTDRTSIPLLGVLALLFRRKGFDVAVAAGDQPLRFRVDGDALTRDAAAREVVSRFPAARGRLFVGSQEVQASETGRR